jgi:kynureninase
VPDAAALDAADPLAAFRDRFVPTPGRIYLDGNSLGRPPRETAARLATRAAEWADRLVTAWPDWVDEPRRIGDALAEHVIGARHGEVLVADSTTVNLFKLAAAVLAADPERRRVVVTDPGNFPTDRYVLGALAAEIRWVEHPTPDTVAAACEPGDVALASFGHVDYRTGERLDLAGITAAARAAGATPVLWDLSHSAGAIAVDLHAAGAELAVGCTYKYLNAGPGAPGYLYVREDLHSRLRSPIAGWFGQRDQFAMGPAYDPEPSIARFHAGTPPVLGLPAVEEGVRLMAQAGVEALEAKAAALTGFALELADSYLAAHGFTAVTPRDPARRGAHVALRHERAWPACQALAARGVIADFRAPDILRLGLPPLSTSYADVETGIGHLRELMAAREFDHFPARRPRVT